MLRLLMLRADKRVPGSVLDGPVAEVVARRRLDLDHVGAGLR